VPRIHFLGTFQADPSTINNTDNSFDPTAQIDPAWNANGSHNWLIPTPPQPGCSVTGAVDDQGRFIGPGADLVVGAQVISAGGYPAKIVDLDPDNQGVSQIWGLVFQISVPDPADPTKVLSSVTGTMPPSAFGDLWNRASNAPRPGMATMCASFQAVLTNVQWVNAAASPILTALQQLSPNQLSIKFNVDSFQPNANQANFTLGRIAGTVGPAFQNEAPRSSPRRLAQTSGAFGPVGCVFDDARNVLVLDLGNCVPTDGTPPAAGPSVPINGWPIVPTDMILSFGVSPTTPNSLKSGVDAASPITEPVSFDVATYATRSGVVEVLIAPGDVNMLQTTPLSLAVRGTSQVVAQEDPQGRYVDVDLPFLRLDPGDTGFVTLWATQFGKPWVGASLSCALTAPQNVGPWMNGDPTSAVTLSSAAVTTTGPNGTVSLTIKAGDPGTPRKYADGQLGPDGQVYQITGDWANWGQIFQFAGAPINLLIFSSYPMPAIPTWAEHVGPIFSNYARMYPFMKGILDLGDQATVVGGIGSIGHVLNLPRTDPHHMPVVRDLSRDKLAMIKKWITNGTP